MAQFETKRFRIQKPDAHKVLPIPAGDRWIFGHHPESWGVEEIDGVDRWVPVLRRFMVTPGCNGVRENGDSSKMEYRFSRDGWTFIENGGKAGEYAYECAARGGSVWLDVWVTPHEFAPGKVKRVKLLTPQGAKSVKFTQDASRVVISGLPRACPASPWSLQT